MKILVDKNLRTPLYWQIADQIKELILAGELVDGAILPSERSLSKMLNVHRNTVIKAYGHLKDQELIDSVPGMGYYVTFFSKDEEEPEIRLKVNWNSLIKDDYQDIEKTFDDIFLRFAEENYISFSTGMPSSVYSEDEIAADFAAILAEESRRPFYLSPYQGDKVLRKQIISYLRTKGIKAGPSQVQIMSGTNQALDFLVATLLEPGDRVIIEEPVSPDVYRVIQLAGCKAITVPVDEEGIMCDNIEGLIETHDPKFIYVNSSFHDPTGNMLSGRRRKKLLELSNRYRLPIIEEDSASELSFFEKFFPTIKSMDKSDNVIYIYSFELTFIPGISMAFVVGPEKLIKSLSYLVSIRVMSLDWITQKLLAKYITDGRYYDKVKEISRLNKEKRDLMASYLDLLKPLGLSYTLPKGGVYIWCKLPEGVDCKQVAAAASKKGIALIPGDVFYPNRNGGQNYVRLNYSYETFSRIRIGMENLVEIIKVLVP